MRRLEALKEIAELLNEATNLQDMLEKVLHTLFTSNEFTNRVDILY